MKSYIAIALVLCLAVAQVMSQGQKVGARKAQEANFAATMAATGSGNAGQGLMGSGLWPMMMAGGSDTMQSFLMLRMLNGMGGMGGSAGSGMFGGLSPLIYGSMLGMELGM